MWKKLKGKASDFLLNHKKDRLLYFYDQKKYDKMAEILKAYPDYQKIKFDDFPFIFYLIGLGQLQPLQQIFKKINYTDNLLIDDQNPMSATPIVYALLEDHHEIVQFFKQKGGNLNHPNQHLQNALHLAAIFKREKAFQDGITIYKVDYNAVDQYHNTPFHYAARTGSVEMVSTLVLCNAKKLPNNQHQYPIHMAIESGNIECMEKLKNDLKMSYSKFHPLHSATRSHNIEMVHRLLDIYPNFVNIQDYRGLTPLHHAVINHEIDMVRVIGMRKQTNLNIQDEFGNTPLHLSLHDENLDISEELLKLKANLDVVNKDFQRAADYGLNSQDPNIRSLMLRNKQSSKTIQESIHLRY